MTIENKEIRQIRKFLIENGFKPNLKGFTYMVDAIHGVSLVGGKHVRMEVLYHDMAEFYGDTRNNVERGIRFLIKNRNDSEGSPVLGMTNSVALYSLYYSFVEWQEGKQNVGSTGDSGMAYQQGI